MSKNSTIRCPAARVEGDEGEIWNVNARCGMIMRDDKMITRDDKTIMRDDETITRDDETMEHERR